MPRKPDSRVIFAGLIVGGVLVLLGIGVFLLRIRYEVGLIAADDAPDQVRALTQMVLDGYDAIISLVTAAFGALAFLVTYQQNQTTQVTTRAWALLSLGLVFLTGALMLALLGREYIVLMLTRNAVELGIPMLSYGRWATYGCVTLAAVFISFFAVEAAISNTRKP